QRVITSNPRSTVGTSTEIYDYLKLLYARIGKTYSPISGEEVKKDTVTSVTNFVMALPQDTVATINAPLHPSNNRTLKEELAILLQKGFVRIIYRGTLSKIEALLDDTSLEDGAARAGDLLVVIDRVTVDGEDDTANRVA